MSWRGISIGWDTPKISNFSFKTSVTCLVRHSDQKNGISGQPVVPMSLFFSACSFRSFV